MNTYHKILASEAVKMLEKHFEVATFPQEFTLIYEHHIPFSGVVLIEGAIELRKKAQLKELLAVPFAIGVKQVMQQRALRVECLVKQHSRLILLSRQEISQLKSTQPDLLKLLLS